MSVCAMGISLGVVGAMSHDSIAFFRVLLWAG